MKISPNRHMTQVAYDLLASTGRASALNNGNLTVFKGGKWVYPNTGEVAKDSPHPCPNCKCFPTSEGHDACLGNIPGAEFACCGHGIDFGYVKWDDGSVNELPVRTKS